jgi:hypothetical protein
MSLAPGPLMDADVARTLWKALVVHDTESNTSYLMGEDWKQVELPKFSTDTNQAHRVVRYMQGHGFTLNVQQVIEHGQGIYQATFMKPDGRKYLFCEHPELPMAICMAAVSAYGGLNIKAD